MHRAFSVLLGTTAIVLGGRLSGQTVIPHSSTRTVRTPQFQSGDYYLISDSAILRVAVDAGFWKAVFSYPLGTTGSQSALGYDSARDALLFSVYGSAVTNQGVVIPPSGATLTLNASGLQRLLVDSSGGTVAPFQCYASRGDGLLYCSSNKIMVLNATNDAAPLLDENGSDTIPFFYCAWLFYYDATDTLFACSRDASTGCLLLSKFPLSANGTQLRMPMTYEHPLNLCPGGPFGGISEGPNGLLFLSADVGGACPSSACCTEKFNLVDPVTLDRSVFTLALPQSNPFNTYTTGYASIYDPLRHQVAAAYSSDTIACLGCDWLAFYDYDPPSCGFPDALFDMGGSDAWHAAPHHLVRIP